MRNHDRLRSAPEPYPAATNAHTRSFLEVRPIPQLYPILDAGLLERRGISIESFARQLWNAGIRFLQYRDKGGTDAQVVERARLLRGIFPPGEATLLLNDRVHLYAASGCDGVHVGQRDVSVQDARAALGSKALLGVSTHNLSQLEQADSSPADYVAVGPVYGTTSKPDPDPVVGVEGVAAARRLTTKPLVAIGGITPGSCAALLQAGADGVAVISGLVPGPGASTAQLVRDFLDHLR